jgi:lipopolysaccharide transport system ATP-binding protein
LLKILSRITEPTKGEIKVKGRIASLLEVGTGFHPELTGRENIFLNGSILGMSRVEIQSKFDEIVAFAEVEKFLDTQVKHYSSGMYVRLAFAVAAHLEPEILIVDEVLAVGDAQFQSKCLSKIDRISKDGRTILFVSHNTTAVRSLCSKVLWLHRGERHAMGQPHTILSDYLGQNNQQKQEHVWETPSSLGDMPAHLTRMSVSSDAEQDQHVLTTDAGILISVVYENLSGNTPTNVSVVLSTPEEVPVLNTWSEPTVQPKGTVECVCRIPKQLLNAGTYRVRVLLVRDGSRAIQDENSTLTFTVLEGPRKGSWMGAIIGVVHPQLDWSAHVRPLLSQRV